MRGEHVEKGSIRLQPGGSSPHARGALGVHLALGFRHGIIPACAGSTDKVLPSVPAGGDHPRMRGEHDPMGLSTSPTRGSSPHARGARHGAGMALPWQRIIPACAGSTHHLHRHSRHGWDHPRMRGEHLGYMIEALDAKGSSPHARGAQCLGAPRAEARRIIPACAGSTACRRVRAPRRRDHPRMRGEHTRKPAAIPRLRLR